LTRWRGFGRRRRNTKKNQRVLGNTEGEETVPRLSQESHASPSPLTRTHAAEAVLAVRGRLRFAPPQLNHGDRLPRSAGKATYYVQKDRKCWCGLLGSARWRPRPYSLERLRLRCMLQCLPRKNRQGNSPEKIRRDRGVRADIAQRKYGSGTPFCR